MYVYVFCVHRIRKMIGRIESSSFSPFLLAHFCPLLTLKEPNYRKKITRQFKLTSDMLS